jgi:hypothetical protein
VEAPLAWGGQSRVMWTQRGCPQGRPRTTCKKKELSLFLSEDGVTQDSRTPGKGNTVKKEKKGDHRGKKLFFFFFFFFGKGGYFEGNLLFLFLFNSVSPVIFFDGLFFQI